MILTVTHDDAWFPVLGVDHRGDVAVTRPVPPPNVLDAFWSTMHEQGSAAGFLLLDPAGTPITWARLHVDPVAPPDTGERLEEAFSTHDLAVTSTTVDTVITLLGPARRLTHLRLVERTQAARDEPRVTVWQHVLWTWSLTSDSDSHSHSHPTLVALSSECPSPHPAVDVVPLVDDLALGLRRGAD